MDLLVIIWHLAWRVIFVIFIEKSQQLFDVIWYKESSAKSVNCDFVISLVYFFSFDHVCALSFLLNLWTMLIIVSKLNTERSYDLKILKWMKT